MKLRNRQVHTGSVCLSTFHLHLDLVFSLGFGPSVGHKLKHSQMALLPTF